MHAVSLYYFTQTSTVDKKCMGLYGNLTPWISVPTKQNEMINAPIKEIRNCTDHEENS